MADYAADHYFQPVRHTTLSGTATRGSPRVQERHEETPCAFLRVGERLGTTRNYVRDGRSGRDRTVLGPSPECAGGIVQAGLVKRLAHSHYSSQEATA